MSDIELEVWQMIRKMVILRKLWASAVGIPTVGIILKNEIMYVFVSHPAHLNEWRLKEEQYMQALRDEYKKRALKNKVVFKKVVVKKKYIKEKEEKEEVKPTYKERAKGDFINHCKNPRLYKIFEDIKEIIRKNNEQQSENLS